ncbi:MAG: LamG domain-containing protein [Ignavibacteria bacterium]|nr:LamG domain-containing protein [Ignavibacteria bacterium]
MKAKLFFSISLALSLFTFSFRDSLSQMYWNQAASFAGNASSYVSVPNSSSLDITGSFTLEALINPSSISGTAKGIISKGGVLGTSLKYCLRMFNGRILVATNGAQRLISRSSTALSVNTWTHVAATYNSSTNQFVIYLNGVSDTSSTVAAAAPTSNPDSLFIGISGSSTPFNGKIDEVRIWNKALISIQIIAFRKSTIGVSGDGIFNNLVLSIPFQNNTGSGTLFSTMDYSDKSNNVFNRNVSAFDLNDRPSGIHQFSDCLNFSGGGGGGLTGFDSPSISPTSKMTIEFWIFPKSDNCGLLFKGSYSILTPDYGMKVSSGKLNAYINNTLIVSNDSVKKERWSHVAFTYFGATGRYEFFVNGKPGTTGNLTPGNIIDGPDSILVAAYPFAPNFTGFIDEFRLTCDLKNISDINNQMFTSINETNDNDASLNAVYNFDASSLPNTEGGPRLNLRDNVVFNFNTGFFSNFPQSPLNNFSPGQFQNGYYLSMPQKRIPVSGTSGTIKDTIEIFTAESITDMNIYVALNHTGESNLRLTLTSPLGGSTEFFANTSLMDSTDNLVTVFDSDADSSLISGRYINFGPKIKPQFDLDAIFQEIVQKGNGYLVSLMTAEQIQVC